MFGRCACVLIAVAACNGTSLGVDATPPTDAPTAITLAETTSPAPVLATSIDCQHGDSYTADTSYYRAFALSDFHVDGPLSIERVDFGVESATAQPADVHLYTYAGAVGAATLDLAKLTPLASAPVSIPDSTLGSMSAPMNAIAPAGSVIVAEIHVADGEASQRVFFLGANQAGESAPGYIRASYCSYDAPTSIATIATTTVDYLITVTGTY